MNNLTKKEILNYFHLIFRQPGHLFCLVKSLIKNRKYFFRRLMRLPDLQSQMPHYLSAIEKSNIAAEESAKKEGVAVEDCQKFSPIHIATGEFTIENGIPWGHDFEDSEDHEALHRWTWLLYKVTEDKSPATLARVESCMKDWISRYGSCPDDSLKWNAYAVSERICNAIVIFARTDLKCDRSIADGLRVMAQHVACHLEYYGPNDTFNHILNNARALYLYGTFFQDKKSQDLATRLFENELPHLITEDDFLREGSSHYHFLITRWLLEVMYFAAQGGDRGYIEKFKDYAARMVQQCHFFLVSNKDNGQLSMPLIGDISPDVTPEWLTALPLSRLAKSFYDDPHLQGNIQGWAKIFNESLEGVEPLACPKEERKCLINEESGWYRLKEGEADLFIYLRPLKHYSHRGHYHNDLLSFCLFLNGRPVFIDCGRVTYHNNDLGRWGQSAAAHNSIVIDGFELLPFLQSSELREFFVQEQIASSISFEQNDNEVSGSLEGRGFGRLGNDLVGLTRLIRLKEDCLEIKDSIRGTKSHRLQTFFHCAPGLQAEAKGEDDFTIRGEGVLIHMRAENARGYISQGKEGSPEGWASSQYGKKQVVSSLIFDSVKQLPITQTYQIHWRS